MLDGDRHVKLLERVLAAAAEAQQVVADQRQRIAELEALSVTDDLTGLANRRGFTLALKHALSNMRRHGGEAALIVVDLDGFKDVNDTFGHAAGDHVLRQTVLACQAHLRVSDIFGRFGGEEFGIVLPGCGLEDAKQRAERLRVAVSSIVQQYEGESCTVSASFGVACTEASGYELRQLLAHADSALYRAKATGRDRVMPYEPDAGSNLSTPAALDSLRNASRA
jgi:diguanylate cyclase (GGDEF)-like protein